MSIMKQAQVQDLDLFSASFAADPSRNLQHI